MKKIVYLVLAILFIATSCQTTKKQEIFIIPQPQQVKLGTSSFSFSSNTVIDFGNDENLKQQANYFSEIINSQFGYEIELVQNTGTKSVSTVNLVIDENLIDLGEEGYKLNIDNDEVIITAPSPKGNFLWFTVVVSITNIKFKVNRANRN